MHEWLLINDNEYITKNLKLPYINQINYLVIDYSIGI